MKYIYLDHASTTPIKKRVLKEMLPYITENFGNPSSVHLLGKKSKEAIENSRIKTANALNCNKNEVYFTSSATESNNWVLKAIAFSNKKKGKHIITTKIEHASILNTCKFLEKQGFNITYLPVNKYGMISLEDLKNSISDETILISIMFANNEIESIQPIKKIGEIAEKKIFIFIQMLFKQ
ncbi:Aminotransferase class-V [Tepidibacter formicigenes DSM 15518]|jgi:cysteine desulfurase|uniref:Aminotransferase class-V n=1 Tax=Tepidibacter formicigenes DSM 15518 TaxID=1123349 RepID=A0A1M6UHZ6_9FIRM|nr:aminotransferase class V-fold PLP-dependent enzyme [Tepidibacter formicigenes]SHK68842.1 Aminotransferase class-V [Tepidibacter formicigenes DSM 15518]